MHSGGLCCRKMFVCLSFTRRYCVETAKYIIKLFPPSGSHSILVFPSQTVWQYSDGNSSPSNGASNAGGIKNQPMFRFISELMQDRAIYYGIRIRNCIKLSNGTIFNELEQPLAQISRLSHYLTLYISQTVRDTYLQWNWELHTSYSKVSFRMTFSDLERLSEMFNDTKHRAVSLSTVHLVQQHILPLSWNLSSVSTYDL